MCNKINNINNKIGILGKKKSAMIQVHTYISTYSFSNVKCRKLNNVKI
jgi:hypothetical protein